jgi:hypothetical protein
MAASRVRKRDALIVIGSWLVFLLRWGQLALRVARLMRFVGGPYPLAYSNKWQKGQTMRMSARLPGLNHAQPVAMMLRYGAPHQPLAIGAFP